MIFFHLHLLQIKSAPSYERLMIAARRQMRTKNMLNIEITSKVAVFAASNVVVGRR